MTNSKKDFIFVSDFDGTLTCKDFYKIIMDKYLGDEAIELYKDWKKGHYLDIDFLQIIYKSINRNEKEILDDIINIDFDEYAETFIKFIKNFGGDFLILSAGTSYYIERLLKYKKINDVTIISNKGYYKDKGIHLSLDPNYIFYSRRYGIDKAKVVQYLKTKYKKVYFAGDSAPDVAPALLADICFAKGTLQELLTEKNSNFVPINNFNDIKNHFEKPATLSAETKIF